MSETYTETWERLTAKKVPCPDCAVPMIAGRISEWIEETHSRNSFVGLVCRPCDKTYHCGED